MIKFDDDLKAKTKMVRWRLIHTSEHQRNCSVCGIKIHAGQKFLALDPDRNAACIACVTIFLKVAKT